MWRWIKKNVEGGQRGIEEERSREKKRREGARHQVGWIHQAAKSCDNWPEGCRSPPARRAAFPRRGRSYTNARRLSAAGRGESA
ncbi:hypothetical protein E2C01_065868 [Portunus trituberculatus]|uniref:Uncharacterized protein n=1 Tax=Portunus trituberculatus TaxID=210409 RepID=A0A5B7HSD1_PORTR|nr:hypothetical protein [Portunus trituberculatus]